MGVRSSAIAVLAKNAAVRPNAANVAVSERAIVVSFVVCSQMIAFRGKVRPTAAYRGRKAGISS